MQPLRGKCPCATRGCAIQPLRGKANGLIEPALTRHQKIGAQLADACLVYLAARDGIDTVFTLGRRDFSVYRYDRNRRLKIIPAPNH